MTPEDIAQRIHDASLKLLEDPGIALQHEGILRLLLSKGARRGERADVLRIPAAMVADALAAAPRAVTLADRLGGSIEIACDSLPVFWSCPGLNILDHDQHRQFTSADMARWARLMQALPHVHGVFGVAMSDVPPAVRDAVGLAVIARNSTKHVRVLAFSPRGAQAVVEIRRAIGSWPWVSVGFTAHGPLRWTQLAMDIFQATAGHGIPTTINGEPMAGVSGPVTLSGSAAVGNAEILAGLVVNQLLEPGRPCIYNLGLAHVLDMRTALAVTGGPENVLLADLSARMGRFYKLPSASWASTESMCVDSQAAMEKMFAFHQHVCSGVSNIWGVGQLESEMTLSPAQAVIDNEMIGYALRYRRGVDADDESLALGVTRQVGIAGSFLDHDHTLEHFRDQLHMPQVLLRDRRAAWQAAGARPLEKVAQQKADELIAATEPPAMPEDLSREIDRIIARAGS